MHRPILVHIVRHPHTHTQARPRPRRHRRLIRVPRRYISTLGNWHWTDDLAHDLEF